MPFCCMDQFSQPPQSVTGIVQGTDQIAYPSPAYAPVIGAMPCTHAHPGTSLFPSTPHQLSYLHHQQQHQQQQQLQAFWSGQMDEIEQTMDFKNHSLPLARIKKIMKADEDVRMISAEAPIIFAKACEMLILELTLRSWIHTEENKRRTLQKNDIAAAITRTDIFDFLVDIIPRDEPKEDGVGIPRAAVPGMGSPVDSVPYYYMSAQPQLVGSGMIVGRPGDQMPSSAYAAAPMMAYAWPQPPVQPDTAADA